MLHWDGARGELAPSSLHYLEGDVSFKAGRTAFPVPPLVATGACAGRKAGC